jgi:hypothetical protein
MEMKPEYNREEAVKALMFPVASRPLTQQQLVKQAISKANDTGLNLDLKWGSPEEIESALLTLEILGLINPTQMKSRSYK